MKNESAWFKTTFYFGVVLLAMVGFGIVSWFLQKPFRTLSAIGALSVITVAFVGMLAAVNYRWSILIRGVNALAGAVYVLGGFALMNLVLMNIWGTPNYYSALTNYSRPSAWLIVVMAVFLATHWIRGDAKKEICALEDMRIEEENNILESSRYKKTEPQETEPAVT